MSYDEAFGFPAKPVTDEQRNTVLAQIQAMNAELEAEAQMKRDAARYEWIRKFWYSEHAFMPQSVSHASNAAEFDAAIDAEIAKEQ